MWSQRQDAFSNRNSRVKRKLKPFHLYLLICIFHVSSTSRTPYTLSIYDAIAMQTNLRTKMFAAVATKWEKKKICRISMNRLARFQIKIGWEREREQTPFVNQTVSILEIPSKYGQWMRIVTNGMYALNLCEMDVNNNKLEHSSAFSTGEKDWIWHWHFSTIHHQERMCFYRLLYHSALETF